MAENSGVCLYCGNTLNGLFRESRRKYCSKSCGWKAELIRLVKGYEGNVRHHVGFSAAYRNIVREGIVDGVQDIGPDCRFGFACDVRLSVRRSSPDGERRYNAYTLPSAAARIKKPPAELPAAFL